MRPSPRARDGRVEAALWFAYGGKNREVLLALVDAFNAAQGRATASTPPTRATTSRRSPSCAPRSPRAPRRRSPTSSARCSPTSPRPACSSRSTASRDAADLDLVPAARAGAAASSGGDARPLVALPFNRSTPIAYYNSALFHELGLAPPRDLGRAPRGRRGAPPRPATPALGLRVPDRLVVLGRARRPGGRRGGRAATARRRSAARPASARSSSGRRWCTRTARMKPPPGRDYNAWQVGQHDFLSGRAAMIWTSTAFLRYLEENARVPGRRRAAPARRARARCRPAGPSSSCPRARRAPSRRPRSRSSAG